MSERTRYAVVFHPTSGTAYAVEIGCLEGNVIVRASGALFRNRALAASQAELQHIIDNSVTNTIDNAARLRHALQSWLGKS